MRLSFGQEMRMVQKQVLAPRMIQSMEILQLPIMALQERIEQELEENPLLEVQEDQPETEEEPEETAENPDKPTQDERELVVDESKDNVDDFERLLQMDEEFPEHFDDRPRSSLNRMEEESDRKHDAMANMVSRPQTLQDYLRDQLAWFDLEPELRQMCERIIYGLDHNGYLETRLDDLLPPGASQQELALAQKALQIIQKLDPPGIGARDLRECLLLQLQPGMPHFEELRTLISSHLEDLEHNRLPVIQRRTGYSIELIQKSRDELRKLNPKPGGSFVDSYVPSVTPDVFVEQDDSGRYKVRLEDGHTPHLFISPYYRQLLMNDKASPEDKEYVKRKINSAQWLIESIEQRRSTLTKVSQAIVDHQTEFLAKGAEYIEPLKMQQIADKVGVHVTTVSRAVDDKWIQTPRGIFPLKRFFGGGTVSASGEEIAWDTVRLRLQEIVDQEDKRRPYSDDELVKELGKRGLTVARRTVTKYRKAMKIPSSRERRDWSLGDAPENSAESNNGAIPSLSPHWNPPASAQADTDAAVHDEIEDPSARSDESGSYGHASHDSGDRGIEHPAPENHAYDQPNSDQPSGGKPDDDKPSYHKPSPGVA